MGISRVRASLCDWTDHYIAKHTWRFETDELVRRV